jgi:hypothetical protein
MKIYLVATALIILLGLVFAFFDFFTGVSHSTSWTLFVLMLGFLAAFSPMVRRRRSLKSLMGCIALFAAFTSEIAALRTLDEKSSVGRFQKLYWSIHAGMSKAEVEALVRREFPTVQPSIRWHNDGGFLGLEPVDKDFNAEFIEIWLENGRVTGSRYLPD